MKSKNPIHTLLLGTALLSTSNAHAQLTWDPTGGGTSDGGGTWTDTGKWWDGGANVDWTDTSNAIFGNGGVGGTVTVGTVSAGTVLLDDFTGTYTLQGTSTTLTQSGGITIGQDAGNVIIKGTGSSALLTIDGGGGLTMNGSGLLNLSTNLVMTYTGSTVINSGVVMLGNAANRSTGNFNLNGGMLTDYYRQTHIFSSGLGTGNNQIQIHGESGFGGGNGNSSFRIGANNSVLTWGDTNFDPTKLKFRAPLGDNNGPSIYGQVSLQNRLDLNSGTRTIDVYRSGANVYGSSATIAGGIQDTGGAGNLVKTGDGTLILGTNTSTWGGTTTVSAGILEFGGTNIANIGGGSGRNISVAAGAVVRFNALSNGILQRIVETSDAITIMTGSTSNAIDFSGSAGANLSGAFLSNYAGNGAKTEISGIITAGGGAYRLGSPMGNGAMGIRQESLLSGANGLIIGGNRVVIVGTHTFTGDTTILDGGRLGLAGLAVGAGAAKNNSFALQNSVLDLGSGGTGKIFLEAGTTAGAITGSTTSVDGGTQSATFGGLKGSRNLYDAFLFTGPGNNTSAKIASDITGFTLNNGSGATVTYSGAIGGFGAGATSGTGGGSTLTKTGVGTQILTGASTYSGATTISEGILAINGTGSINNSAVTINGGNFRYNSSTAYTGTLAFTSGKISGTNWTSSLGNLTIGTGQTVSPGNSPGTASTTDQTWANGGTYEWEINSTLGNVGEDPGWDLITGTGTLTITAALGTEFTIDVTSLTLSNLGGDLSDFNDALSYNWLIADFATVIGFDADAFTVDTSGFSNAFTGDFAVALGNTGSIGGTDSQIYLTYTATVIPEPRAALLSSLGLLLLLRRRR